MSQLPDLLVAAIALVRDRRVLMVTARDRDVHYMPGGKIDPASTDCPLDAVAKRRLRSRPLPRYLRRPGSFDPALYPINDQQRRSHNDFG